VLLSSAGAASSTLGHAELGVNLSGVGANLLGNDGRAEGKRRGGESECARHLEKLSECEVVCWSVRLMEKTICQPWAGTAFYTCPD